jgi:hypothetical protein
MTFAQMSTADKNSVCTVQKTAQDETWFDPPGTHYPDYSDIRRILQTRNTRCVCRSITAPVAEKPEYPGLITQMYTPGKK